MKVNKSELKQIIREVLFKEQVNDDKTYYVAGGEYYHYEINDRFRLVKPTGGQPYVATNLHKLDLTSHHSHLYKLSPDKKTAISVQKRTDGVGAPKQHKLSIEDYNGVMKRIKSGNVYESVTYTSSNHLLKGTKYSVKLDPNAVKFVKLLHLKEFKPIVAICPTCHKPEYVEYKRVRKGEELTYVYYKCLNCGLEDTEPID